jgi:hypothetical protein
VVYKTHQMFHNPIYKVINQMIKKLRTYQL